MIFCSANLQRTESSPESLTSQIIHHTQCLHVTKLSLRFACVQSVKNSISKSALHRLVCILALLSGIKFQQTLINYYIIVILRHITCNRRQLPLAGQSKLLSRPSVISCELKIGVNDRRPRAKQTKVTELPKANA